MCEWRRRVRDIAGLHGIETPEKARAAWGRKVGLSSDGCREEEFPPVPVVAEIPGEVQAFLAWERGV